MKTHVAQYVQANQPAAHIAEVLERRSAAPAYASLVLCVCSSTCEPAFLNQADWVKASSTEMLA